MGIEERVWWVASQSMPLWRARKRVCRDTSTGAGGLPLEDEMSGALRKAAVRSTTGPRLLAAGLMGCLFAALAPQVFAYEFEPTEAEFNAWPFYCRARYASTMFGRNTVYAQRMDRTAQASAESAIGPQTFLHIHHYCAGLVHLARSRLEADTKQRRFQLDEARAEMLYSLRNETGTGPLWPTIVVNLAVVERERGDVPAARKLLEEAIRVAPSDPRPYLGLAILLRAGMKLAEARSVLEQGIAATGSDPLELHYNLGLICLELENFDCAIRHAQIAYAKDYPFSGLRDRLTVRGLWQE